jgi:hypothetical protein
MEDIIRLTGSVNVRLIGPDGQVKQEHTDHNLVVTVGKTYLTAFLTPGNHNTGTEFAQFVGLGTNSSGPTSGDTALGAELSGGGYSRATGTLTNLSNAWTNTATFNPGNGTGAITEAGLFSASTSGTLFARQVFSVYNKAAGDTMVIVWSVTFS